MARHTARSARRGFSLVEAMVAAAILGIALLGLVQLHKSSMRGTVRAQAVGQASEVARQLAELVASQDFNTLPNCLPGAGPAGGQLPAPPAGCRATVGPGTVFSAEKANGCTIYSNGAAVPGVDPANNGDAGTAADRLRYRVDMAVSQHPDVINYPDSALVTVWVCWTEEGGTIREISASRLVTQGL